MQKLQLVGGLSSLQAEWLVSWDEPGLWSHRSLWLGDSPAAVPGREVTPLLCEMQTVSASSEGGLGQDELKPRAGTVPVYTAWLPSPLTLITAKSMRRCSLGSCMFRLLLPFFWAHRDALKCLPNYRYQERPYQKREAWVSFLGKGFRTCHPRSHSPSGPISWLHRFYIVKRRPSFGEGCDNRARLWGWNFKAWCLSDLLVYCRLYGKLDFVHLHGI